MGSMFLPASEPLPKVNQRGDSGKAVFENLLQLLLARPVPVSYTHLTLPTILRV